MTEESSVFDPSLKKKKKKKRTPFDIDAALDGGSAPVGEDETCAPEVEDSLEDKVAADDDVDLDMFSMKKKKKNKKKTTTATTLDEDESAVDETLQTGAGDEGSLSVEGQDFESTGTKKKKKTPFIMEDLLNALPTDDNQENVDLGSFGKKKKKKKRAGAEAGGSEEADFDKDTEESNPWFDSDRDYTYDELLQRVFNIMKDKNPEMVAGEKKKFVMRPPQVVRVGTKKTAFVNFTEISKMLHRQPKHLLSFLFAELGTVGAIDGNNQLVLKGRYQQKHMENVLRRYIVEYVTCHTCRSPDTILAKETRLFFLQCMTCHSRCSVQTIKTGFQAVTGKRAAIRAKQ